MTFRVGAVVTFHVKHAGGDGYGWPGAGTGLAVGYGDGYGGRGWEPA